MALRVDDKVILKGELTNFYYVGAVTAGPASAGFHNRFCNVGISRDNEKNWFVHIQVELLIKLMTQNLDNV